MWKVSSIFVFSLALVADGFFFRSSGRDPEEIEQVAQKGIENRCVQQGTDGDCSFYTCINERFPCGRNGFVMHFGLYYCQRTRTKLNKLNTMGKRWANATLKCQVNTLKPIYESSSQTCKAISNAGFDAMHRCFIDHGFCDINWDNRDAIWEIFDASDLSPGSAGSGKMWTKILQISGSCVSEKATQFTSWLSESTKGLREQVEGFFQGVWDKIKSRF